MSSSICRAFEANAWRKDLCSHCFRSKEEHEQSARYHPPVNCDPSSVTDCVSSRGRYQSPIGSSSRSCSYLNSSALRPLTCSVTAPAPDSLPTCPSISGHQVIHPLTSSQHSTQLLTNTKRWQSADYLLTSNAAPTQPRPSSDINRFLLSLQPKDDEPAMTSVRKIPAGIKGSRSVQFPDEAVHVIGYGGEECFYSDEDDTIDDEDDDDPADEDNLTEEERKMVNLTQKNTSFNSVSRNLLVADASTIATFVSHGISLPSAAKNNNQPVKAPLVTIRPFVNDHRPADLKIHLVSPMRNGQLVNGGVAKSGVSSAAAMKMKEELKNQENLNKEDPPAKMDDADEKFTSFCDPSPEEEQVTCLPAAVAPEDAPDCSKPASNRIMLSRKPPVLKEKPRVPIKPQTALHRLERTLSSDPAVVKTPPIHPLPHASLTKSDSEPIKTAVCSVPEVDPPKPVAAAAPEPPANPQIRSALSPQVISGDRCGQISVRFVNITSGPAKMNSAETGRDSTAVPAEDNPPAPADRQAKLNVLAQELNAVKRLDELTVAEEQAEAVSEAQPKVEVKSQAKAEVIRSAAETSADQTDPTSSAAKPPACARESPTKRSNSTRGLTRSAFEVLRANLAGSLELTRMYPRTNNNRRPAPPLPEPSPVPPILAFEPVVEVEPSAAPEPVPVEEIPPAPHPPEESVSMSLTEPERSVERSRPSSPMLRSASISFAPEGTGDDVNELQPRSVSLTRAEQRSTTGLAPKPPSIRRILKERATQLFQLADGIPKTPADPRLSRSEQFALDGKKSGKSRGLSAIRKFLGKKKDLSHSAESDSPSAPSKTTPAPKVRPEILHPLDFHCGSVQVVSVKPNQVNVDPLGIYSDPRCIQENQSDSSFSSCSLTSSPAPSLNSPSIPNRPRPPPPPRIHSMDKGLVRSSDSSKPVRPPPPTMRSMPDTPVRKSNAPEPPPMPADSGQYASVGETLIRPPSGASPVAPARRVERSASVRTSDRHSVSVNVFESLPEGDLSKFQDTLHYDCVAIQPSLVKSSADEDGYIVPMRMKSKSFTSSAIHRHSMSSFHPPSSRSSGDGQPDADPSNYSTPLQRGGRPSLRQSRQELEDHYGTVTGANFQALAQLLEQATTKRPLAAHFHELRRSSKDLKWNHFSGDLLLKTNDVTVLRSRWDGHEVLVLAYDLNTDAGLEDKVPFAQPAIIAFQDQITQGHSTYSGGIELFPPGEVATLSQMTELLDQQCNKDESLQRGLCALLQICRAFSWMQEKGIQQVDADQIVFYRENSQDFHRLLWLPPAPPHRYGVRNPAAKFARSYSDRNCADLKDPLHEIIGVLSPCLTVQLAKKLSTILSETSVKSLEKVALYAEYLLFGPTDDLIGQVSADPLPLVQRWLDVERASVLNDLIRTQGLWRIKLSVLQEFHLCFLVSVCPQTLIDAGQI